jgi:hypothetical protein
MALAAMAIIVDRQEVSARRIRLMTMGALLGLERSQRLVDPTDSLRFEMEMNFVVETDRTGVRQLPALPAAEGWVIRGEAVDVRGKRRGAIKRLQVFVATCAMVVRNPRQDGSSSMFLVATRTSRIRDAFLMMRADGMAVPTGGIRYGADVRIAPEQADCGLERVNMADATFIIEHGVGARNRAGFINETCPWPPRYSHQPGASDEDGPSQKVAAPPDAAGPPEIIQLNPVGQALRIAERRGHERRHPE